MKNTSQLIKRRGADLTPFVPLSTLVERGIEGER